MVPVDEDRDLADTRRRLSDEIEAFRVQVAAWNETPVKFPPGLDRLATSPKPTGSLTPVKTTGTVWTTRFAAAAAGAGDVKMTSILRLISSVASRASAFRCSSMGPSDRPWRDSMIRLRPSIQPPSRKPSRNPSTALAGGGPADPADSQPTRAILPAGCASPTRDLPSMPLARIATNVRREVTGSRDQQAFAPRGIIVSDRDARKNRAVASDAGSAVTLAAKP